MSNSIRLYWLFLRTVLVFGVTALCFAQPAPEPLAWDSQSKQHTLTPGETTAHFAFSVTNVSAAEVVVEKVSASCGCTAVQLPATPWRLAPGNHGDLRFTMDLRGKRGTVTKTATVQTSAGMKVLTLSAIMPDPGRDTLSPGAPLSGRDALPRVLLPSRPAPPDRRPAGRPYQVQGNTPSTLAVVPARAGSPLAPALAPRGGEGDQKMQNGDRTRNQALAKADHQAVFRGDCARCHAEPAKGKLGKELYVAVCGICHDAEHRAEMVPLLGKSPLADNPAYWRTWITFGKPGSLMPAFSKPLGGPLDREQIESLAAFLASTNFPAASRVERRTEAVSP